MGGSRPHPSPLRCQVRTELERRTGRSLAQHKDFIDNEMLLVLAQMDRPSCVFPHLYLVGSGAGCGQGTGGLREQLSPTVPAATGLRVERCQPGGAAAEPVGEGLSAAGRAGGQRGARPPSSAPALCSITHILNVAREIDNFFPALFTYMNVRVYDEEAAELLPHWNDTFLFLSDVKSVGMWRGRGHRGTEHGGLGGGPRAGLGRQRGAGRGHLGG